MTKDSLQSVNVQKAREAATLKSVVEARRSKRGFVSADSYFMTRVRKVFAAEIGVPEAEVHLRIVGRAEHKADLCIMVQSKIRELGNGRYIKEFAPALKETILGSAVLKAIGIVEAEQKGIYLNLRFSDSALLGLLAPVFELTSRYGESDLFRQKNLVIDYSHPNIAKHLHPGHIRSTIIGHAIANLFEAAGGVAYRMNHMNDWGGFGVMLHGITIWRDKLPKHENKNDILYEIYTVYRRAEKGAESPAAFSALTADERALCERYFGPLPTHEELASKLSAFTDAATACFRKLERGDAETVALWQELVQWSLDDFKRFYDALGIHLDFNLFESFFALPSIELVKRLLESGRVVRFNEELLEKEKKTLAARREAGEITDQIYESLLEENRSAVGAYVVSLSGNRKLVVYRGDESTIYSTRDLAAIEYRVKHFNASDIVYVVGQEQGDYFQRVFEAARVVGIAEVSRVNLEHIYFGFYVDSKTKSKLSSRAGARGVLSMIAGSHDYFLAKYDDSSPIPATERREIARKLGIGSIIFNDLKKDKKAAVELNSDLTKMFADFELSGGAYVAYTACRARSILRKYGKPLPPVSEAIHSSLQPEEASLLTTIAVLPDKIVEATRSYNPSIVLGYVFALCQEYNSYYNKFPVIKAPGEAHLERLLITAAVAQTIENTLAFCQIECPDRI